MPGPADLQPVVTLSGRGGVLEASWPPISEADAYEVDVTDSGSGALMYSTRIPADQYAPPVRLSSDAFTPAADASYTVVVSVLGMPSAPQTVTMPHGAGILGALRDRFMAARTQPDASVPSYVYPLSDTVLPAAGDGDPAAVRTSLSASLAATPSAPLAITSAATELALTDQTLTLTGASPALTGDPDTAVTLVFSVGSDLKLQATWTAAPTSVGTIAGWTLAEAFETLAGTGFDYLPLSAASFVATTFAHTDAGFFFPLQPGLHFQATLAIRADLNPASGAPDEQGAHRVRVGGPVTLAAGGAPRFAWTGESAVGPFTITRIGQPGVVMGSGTIKLSSTPDPAGTDASNSLTINGQAPIAATPVNCVLDLPTALSPDLHLRAVGPAQAPATLTAALADCGVGDVYGTVLPETLLALAGVQVTGFDVQFSPAGDGPTTTTLTFGFDTNASSWTIAGGLTVSGIVLTVTVVRAPGYGPDPVVSFTGSISGMLTLNQATYAITAGVPPSGAWYVQLTDMSNVPTLVNLAGLAGLSESQVKELLPFDLGQSFTLSNVALLADPGTQQLAEVDFTILQTQPWPLAGGLLTVSDWTIGVAIVRNGDNWDPSGLLEGSVSLAAGGQSTTVDLSLELPIGPDSIWTLALNEDSPVHLPTIGQILALLGGNPAALPTGITDLGGLDVTMFTISVDPSAVKVQHVAFACDQASDWVIIPGSSPAPVLAVTGLSASLAFRPGTTPAGVAGSIGGNLVLAGTPVDVNVLKDSFDGGWVLTAGYENWVHVPGFDALDKWLSPDGSQAALPSSLPLSHGFDVGEIRLAFAAGADGELTEIGFSVFVSDLWTVLPGYLSLTNVLATLTLPYPVVATDITGTVAAVLTIGGADIGVSAKKQSTTEHWEFSGTLLAGLTIDLVEAADELSPGSALALPADAVTHGLPAAITIENATVRAIPDTGLFHFDGSAAFDWDIPLGGDTLTILSIGGTIDVPQTGVPLRATLTGTLEYAGFQVALALAIGGPAAQTVLTGELTQANAAKVQISGLTDSITAPTAPGDVQKRWADVVPTGLPALTFSKAALYLNLTTSQLLLYGALSYGGNTAAQAMVYLSSGGGASGGGAGGGSGAGAETSWTYAVALALGPGFKFGSLLPVLSVIDDYLHVTSAAFVVCDLAGQTLGELSTASNALLASIARGTQAPLAGLESQALQLSTGAYFIAKIDFSTVTLFDRLVQIGSDTNPPTVWLEALIDRANPVNTVFSANLPDIEMLGAILLTHTDAHPGIYLSYSPGVASRFELDGRIKLVGDLSGYQFDVTLTVDDAGLTSTVQQTSQQIENPLGVPGVLSGLALGVSYRWAVPPSTGNPSGTQQTSLFALSGHMLLGPAPGQGQQDQRPSLAAKLALRDSTPVLFDVALDRDFAIGAFLAQCITGDPGNWPSSFIELTFLTGTRIYYYAQGLDQGGTIAKTLANTSDGYTYDDGFNIDAHIKLTLVTTISVHGVLRVLRDPDTKRYAGVQAGLRLDGPLDLVFVSLASNTPPKMPGQPYTGGPLVAFQTGASPSFVLKTGINFLQSAFLAVEVAVSSGSDGGTILAGRLTAAQPLAPFGVLSCGFRYTGHPSRSGDFAIEGWPDFTWAENLIDFVHAIKALANTQPGSLCGALADLVVTNAYDSSFKLSPSVSVQGTSLVFAFTGTYALTIKGASDPFVSMTLPPFSVPIPSSTRWETLPSALASGFAQASGQFARDLLRQPDKIAMFLAMVIGPKAVSVALELACNALVDASVAAAVEAALDAIVGAGGAAAGGAATAAGKAITKSVAESGSTGNGGPGTVDTPHLRSVTYANGQVTGSWDAASGAAGYTFQLVTPDGTTVVAQRDCGMALGGSLHVDPAPLAPGTYQGQVKGIRGDQSSGWASLPLVKLAAPGVSLFYTDPDLRVNWQHMNSDGFVVQFFEPDGQQIGSDIGKPGSVVTTSIPLPDPAPGNYAVAVQALVNGQFPGMWGHASVNALTEPAPHIAAVTQTGGALVVSWREQVPQAIFEAQVTYAGTLLASASGRAQATLTPTTPLSSGTTYVVRVRMHHQTALSPWSSQDFTVWLPPAPRSVMLAGDAGAFSASWDQVSVPGAPAATYNLQLTDLAAPGTVAGALQGVTGTTATPARTDGQTPPQGSRYSVQVQADVGGNLGPWAASAPLDVVTLPPPTAVLVSAAGTALTVTWAAPPLQVPLSGPLSYSVIISRGRDDVDRADDIPDTSYLAFQHGGPGGLGDFAARVRASVPLHKSGWASGPPVAVMDVPQIVNVSYGATFAVVTWTDSRIRPATYEIGLTPPGASQPTQIMPVSGAQIRLYGDSQPPATYAVRVRALSANSVGDWSDPQAVALIGTPGEVSASYDGQFISITWEQIAGATGYLVVVTGPNGTAVISTTVSRPAADAAAPTTAALPATGLARGVTFMLTVAAVAGTTSAAPSVPVPVTLVDPPTKLVACFSGTTVAASWWPSPGATSYQAQLINPAGQTVASPVTSTTNLDYGSPAITPGNGYTIRVSGLADVPGPWSQPADVRSDGYTCLCVGAEQVGAACHGVTARGPVLVSPFTGTYLGIGMDKINVEFPPNQLPRTGWVAVRPGVAGQVAVLAQIVARLAAKGILTGTEPFDIFSQSQLITPTAPEPSNPQPTAGSSFTCLCLGAPQPGGGCGNGAVSGLFGDVHTSVPQADRDALYLPSRAPTRTGWVSVADDPYMPLEVLLQLVAALAGHGTLTGSEPWDVFNATTFVTVTSPNQQDDQGTTTLVVLGSPIGQAATTQNCRFGDVVIGVNADLVNHAYQPGPATGWAAIGSAGYNVLLATARLVTLLAQKGQLTGSQPFDIFNNAAAAISGI